MALGWQMALMALATGTASLILAILAMRVIDRRLLPARRAARASLLDGSLQPIILLFREGVLIDATDPARMLLNGMAGSGDTWRRLASWLAPRFPGAVERISAGIEGRTVFDGGQGDGSARMRLIAEPLGNGLLRVTITDPVAEHAGIVVDSLAQAALESEVESLRRAMDQTPMLVWRQDSDGQISWANAAYLRAADAALGDDRAAWPLPHLLEPTATAPGRPRRGQIEIDGVVHWFDCHSHVTGDHQTLFALPADAAVRAERSLREFVQTLTKTFADLPIGLAVFDRERRLQLFNPALIDLTGLPTGFLTARPTLFDLLDRLREMRMVPEPKDYRSWRQQMNNLEAAAATGHHVETWSLPGGQTYRVTGRPHPDGAVAFLFDDITSEISLTRKFRAELTLGAHVLDGLEDALAVFSPSGQMLLSNRNYVALWGEKSETLAEAQRIWAGRSAAGPGFAALQRRLRGDITIDPSDADPATGAVAPMRDNGAMTAPDGGLLGWHVRALGSGRVMVRFRAGMGDAAAPQMADVALPASDAAASVPLVAGGARQASATSEQGDLDVIAPPRRAV